VREDIGQAAVCGKHGNWRITALGLGRSSLLRLLKVLQEDQWYRVGEKQTGQNILGDQVLKYS